MTQPKTFEQLLFDGALAAVRTLTLEELYVQLECLHEMDMPEDIAEFPMQVLAIVIAEKQNQRAMN